MPGKRLRIVLGKVREESSVREMPKAGAVVCHDVGRARNVVVVSQVTEVALV